MPDRSIQLEEAITAVTEATVQLPTERIGIEYLAGRILAEDLYSAANEPPFPRALLDGYAVRSEDTRGADAAHPAALRVVGRVCAGVQYSGRIREGEAMRVMTGARIPEGADAVIGQEHTDCGRKEVLLYREVRHLEKYGTIGRDIKMGEPLLRKGAHLNSVSVAILAAAGISEVCVVRKPRIAVLSTGDELIRPGNTLEPGQVYDCNGLLISGRLRELGAESQSFHIKDDPGAMEQELHRLLRDFDAVITTGGTGRGDHDAANRILARVTTEVPVPGISAKPGGSTWYALVDGKPWLALPGNPMGASAMLELYGRAMLSAMLGSRELLMKKRRAVWKNPENKGRSGHGLSRGFYEDGKVTALQGGVSNRMLSALQSNCLMDVSETENDSRLVNVYLT